MKKLIFSKHYGVWNQDPKDTR